MKRNLFISFAVLALRIPPLIFLRTESMLAGGGAGDRAISALPAKQKKGITGDVSLLKLAKFVVSKTVSEGCEASDKTLDTLENMNLQIARGLMESIRLPPVKENAAVLIQTAQRLADAAKNNPKKALPMRRKSIKPKPKSIGTLTQTKSIAAAAGCRLIPARGLCSAKNVSPSLTPNPLS